MPEVYVLRQEQETEDRKRRGGDAPLPRRPFARPDLPPPRQGVPLSLLLEIVLLIAAFAVLCFWPESADVKRKTDQLIAVASMAREAANEGEYRLAFVQYTGFLISAEKSDVRPRRLRVAMDDARAELVRIRPLVAIAKPVSSIRPATRPVWLPLSRPQPATPNKP